MELLRVAAGSNHMVRMGIADMDGWMETTDGRSLSVSGSPVILRALDGEAAVSDVAYSPHGGGDGGGVRGAALQDCAQVGVLAGSALLDDMRSYLGVESFGGEGYSVIVDRQGDVVTSTDSKNAPDEDLNLFLDLELGRVDRGYDIGQVRSDMESGRSGILYYALRDGILRRWSTSRWTTTTGTSSRWCPPRRREGRWTGWSSWPWWWTAPLCSSSWR